MRCTHVFAAVVAVCCYVAVLQSGHAAPVVPLRLEMSLDSPVVLATPLELRRAGADSARLTVDTTRVTLALINEGATPLKVNVWALTTGCWRFEVTGPRPGSVVVADYQAIRRLLLAAKESDVITLAPGARWECPLHAPFPAVYEGFPQVRYLLQDPGSYRVRARFDTVEPLPEVAQRQPWQQDLWYGVVTSNECPLDVVVAGPAVNGLRAGLLLGPAIYQGTTHPAALVLKNETQQPLALQAWEAVRVPFVVRDAAGQETPFTPLPANHQRELTAAEREFTLAPGATTTIPWTLHLDPARPPVSPTGSVWVEARNGMPWGAKLPAGAVALVAQYEGPVNVDRARLWQGAVASAPVPVTLDPTVARAAALTAGAASFTLDLNYVGGQDKPFYTLHLQTTPVAAGQANSFQPTVQLTPAEVTALIKALAAAHYLRDAVPDEPVAASPTPPATGYTLHLHADPDVALRCELGWDAGLAAHLKTLATCLPASAQPGLAMLQGRLSGLLAQWQAPAALQQRYTLDVAGQPLPQAVASLQTLVGQPPLRIALPKADAAAPLPALQLQFRDATALSILQALGRASGLAATLTPDGGTVQYK